MEELLEFLQISYTLLKKLEMVSGKVGDFYDQSAYKDIACEVEDILSRLRKLEEE